MELEKAIPAILQSFGLHQYAFQPLGEGHIHDTYLISKGDHGSEAYVLQRVNHQVFREPHLLMENVDVLRNHLADGIDPSHEMLMVLNYLKTNEGKSLSQDKDGNFWRLTYYVPNTCTIQAVTTVKEAELGAGAFGQFIRDLSDLSIERIEETIPKFHHATVRMNQFQSAVEQDSEGRYSQVKQEVDYVFSQMDIIDEANRLHELLPIRITHNDTKINNLLFSKNKDKVYSVIDFDTVMPGLMLYDFGDMVRTFVPDRTENYADFEAIKFRQNIFEGLAKGFLKSVRSIITDTELETLVFGGKLMTYIQGMRFLMDYLSGDIYFSKITRSDQNLIRARNQFFLLEALKKHESSMQKAVFSFS